MEEEDIDIRATRRTMYPHDLVEIFLLNRANCTAAASLQFVPVERGAMLVPAIQLVMSEAQLLIDALWQVGLRPTEGTGSAGSLAATEKHLQDMRTIAFGSLMMERPQ
jgi:hypothetical protein